MDVRKAGGEPKRAVDVMTEVPSLRAVPVSCVTMSNETETPTKSTHELLSQQPREVLPQKG